MKLKTALVMILLSVASISLSEEPIGNHLDAKSQKVIFVDIVKLVKSVYPNVELEMPCFAGPHGTACNFKQNEENTGSISVRVCKDKKEAEIILQDITILPLQPSLDNDNERFGDESYSYRGPEWKGRYGGIGSIRFRLMNVTTEISWKTMKEMENMAAVVEKSIRQGTNGVSLGTEIVAFEIAELNIPEKMKFREKTTADIIIKNIDPENVLFSSFATNVIVRSGKKPTIEYYAPVDGSTEDKFTIYASHGGVVSTKEIVVKITDVPEELVKKRSILLEK